MKDDTEQPIPDNEGEWRVDPEPVHGWRIIDNASERKIVGNIYFEEDARQIVSDHKAAKSQALLVEALGLARKTLMVYAEDDHVDNPEELIAIRYIDAALKAAGVEGDSK